MVGLTCKKIIRNYGIKYFFANVKIFRLTIRTVPIYNLDVGFVICETIIINRVDKVLKLN